MLLASTEVSTGDVKERRAAPVGAKGQAAPPWSLVPAVRGQVTTPVRFAIVGGMPEYDMRLDDKYGQSTLIDVAAEAAQHEPWFNQTLTTVNDSVVRLGVIDGDFHWHKHDVEDEFFYVVDGQLLIDIEDGPTVTLEPRQGYTVPRGVVHRTRAPERTVILMVEPAGVQPTGD